MHGDAPKDGAREGVQDSAAELEALAEDWIALWQSEIAALAADREAAETWAAMSAAWAGLGAAWLRAATAPPFGRAPPGYPPGYPIGYPTAWPSHDRPASPPWPAPAAAAPDPGRQQGDGGDRERGQPADRIAELERRLAELERGRAENLPGRAGGDAPDRRGPRRRKPPA